MTLNWLPQPLDCGVRPRRCPLGEITVDEHILVNQVASYWGRPVAKNGD